jgi:hypothetical protein
MLREHLTITQPEHHRGIPTSARTERKILIYLQNMSPVVEVRLFDVNYFSRS